MTRIYPSFELRKDTSGVANDRLSGQEQDLVTSLRRGLGETTLALACTLCRHGQRLSHITNRSCTLGTLLLRR
jgi:hypothetical protein